MDPTLSSNAEREAEEMAVGETVAAARVGAVVETRVLAEMAVVKVEEVMVVV